MTGYKRQQEIMTGYIRLNSNYDWFGANKIVVCGWLHKTRDYDWLHKTLDFKLWVVWYRCNCCLWLVTHDIETSRDYDWLHKLFFPTTTSLVQCDYCLWLAKHDKSLWLVTYDSYFKLRLVRYKCNCCLWLVTHDSKSLWLVTISSITICKFIWRNLPNVVYL